MWIIRYLVCLVSKHIWAGSIYRYCLRCGKLEMHNLAAEERALNFHRHS